MAKVYVWLPSRSAQGGINVGHASLLADRAARPAYVSWWPTLDHGVGKSQPGTDGHHNNTFEKDVEWEEGRAPIAVDLPCLWDQSIADWWERIKDIGFAVPYSLEVLPESNSYDLYANSCSTIVFRAMVVGGAQEVLACPKFDTITPPHILAWAKGLALAASVKEWFSVPLHKRIGF